VDFPAERVRKASTSKAVIDENAIWYQHRYDKAVTT
jgi:hypothetical protein